MNYNTIKLATYESYKNGEISKNAAIAILESVDDMYVDNIVKEARDAENEFINSALQCVNENASFSVMTEGVADLGEKIKGAWKKLGGWIKSISSKITNFVSKTFKKLGSCTKQANCMVVNGLKEALAKIKSIISKIAQSAPGKLAGYIATYVAALGTISWLGTEHDLKRQGYTKCKVEDAEAIKKDAENIMDDAEKLANDRAEKASPDSSESKIIDIIRKCITAVKNGIMKGIKIIPDGLKDYKDNISTSMNPGKYDANEWKQAERHGYNARRE